MACGERYAVIIRPGGIDSIMGGDVMSGKMPALVQAGGESGKQTAQEDNSEPSNEQNSEQATPIQGEVIPPAKNKGGRPRLEYDPEIGARVCELVAGGSNLSEIGREDNGLPSKGKLYQWRREVGVFMDSYASAREARADARADRIDGYKVELEAGNLQPNVARTLFDIERWQAGKEKPGTYGDKAIIEGGDKPIVFTELSELDAVNKLALLLAGLKLEDGGE